MTVNHFSNGGSKTQVTGQVRSQVRSDQVNRKNIFLPRKLTIFNSKLTRYEKEFVIMRGIVYFKLQDVALRDPSKQNENNEFHVQIASYFVVLRTYGYCHNLFNLYFS